MKHPSGGPLSFVNFFVDLPVYPYTFEEQSVSFYLLS